MANGIKIGSLNIDSLKVGSGDCTVYLGTTLLYSGGTPPAPHDYSQDYLTFRALEDGTFKFSGNSINYSLDSGVTWTELASDTDSPTVNSGDTILWKASLRASSKGIGRFSSSGQFEVEGNIMSLKFGDNFSGQTTLNDNSSLKNLFSGCTSLTSAENLILPATTLIATMCYESMFWNCSNLTKAPKILPATTLAQYCYSDMFRNCTSLTTAPILPAITLASMCYNFMFASCSNLATAPTLSATTLAIRCYESMFWNCSSLNSITCLATDISASGCISTWVSGVAASGTFTKAASMASWGSGDNGIPNNWTVQDYQEN